jgi:hypothetical protein
LIRPGEVEVGRSHPPRPPLRRHRPPTAARTTQLTRHLVRDLHDVGATANHLVRDRDRKDTAAFDAVLEDEGITIVKAGIRVPRMKAIMERWSARTEPNSSTGPDRGPGPPPARAPRYVTFYNEHRTHHALDAAAALSTTLVCRGERVVG